MGKISLSFFVAVIFSGCTWLNILDTNPEPSKNYYKFQAHKRTEAYEYIGKSKGEVKIDWGEPEHKAFKEPYCARENENCTCIQDKCGAGIEIADEWWRYTEKERIGFAEWVYYSVDFYFVDGVVVKTR